MKVAWESPKFYELERYQRMLIYSLIYTMEHILHQLDEIWYENLSQDQKLYRDQIASAIFNKRIEDHTKLQWYVSSIKELWDIAILEKSKIRDLKDKILSMCTNCFETDHMLIKKCEICNWHPWWKTNEQY